MVEDELTEEQHAAIEAHHASLPFTPGPWEAEQEDTEKSFWRVTSKAYTDEEPGVCGNHSRHWSLTESDARCIALLPEVYDFLVKLSSACLPGCACDKGEIVDEAIALLARFKG